MLCYVSNLLLIFDVTVSGITSSTSSAMQHRPSARNAQMKIFTDDNVVTSAIPAPNNEYLSVPLPGAENVQKPGKWTDANVCYIFNVSLI